MIQTLETQDLILKKGKYDDWEDMYNNLWKHKESAKYMLWTPTETEEKAKERMIASIEYGKKNPESYFVYEKKSGQAIGFAGMIKVGDGVYEDTGIAIGPEFVCRGYGRQILKILVKRAFEELGAERFISSCRSSNIASKRLQRSCGFTYTHSEEKVDKRTGEKYELEFYELRKEISCMIIVDQKKLSAEEAYRLFSQNIEEAFRYCGDKLIEFTSEAINTVLRVAFCEALGYYLNYSVYEGDRLKQELMSLWDAERLDEIIEYDVDCLASAGLFVPVERALPEIKCFLEKGIISDSIRWILPEEMPEDGNW